MERREGKTNYERKQKGGPVSAVSSFTSGIQFYLSNSNFHKCIKHKVKLILHEMKFKFSRIMHT